MAKVPSKFRELAGRLISEQKKLKDAQVRYEEMSRVHYELPEPLQRWEWIRPFRSTAPYDALRGATRALANLDEGLSIHPITVAKAIGNDDSKAARLLANQWETTLKWQLKQAGQRYMDLRAAIVYSVALYDEAIIQLIHLPTEFKAREITGWRADAAYRYGDWAVKVIDPKLMYVEYSDFMPEVVMMVSGKSGLDIQRRWGPASGLDEGEQYVEYDITGEDGRIVFATLGEKPEIESDEDVADISGKAFTVLGPEPWLKDASSGDQVPFLPYICAVGGSAVDLEPEHSRKPLLYPVLRSEQWAMTNVAGTLAYSQQITMASQPKGTVTGPGAETVAIDYTDPVHLLRLNAGQQFQQLQAQGLDRGLIEVLDRHDAAIQKATLADILVTGRPISGEQAFASYNLQIQQAIASLGGIRAVAEDAFRKLYTQMLLIAHYTGSDINAYSAAGEKYTIGSEEIDPFSIQLDVELRADVPADRLQRVNAGATLVAQLGWSRKDAAAYLGETDPEGVFRRAKLEMIELADLQAQIERMQRERSGQYQDDVLAAAQALLQQQMAQQQQAMAQGQAGVQAGGQQMGEGGLPGGQQFNPAAGGLPPSTVSPEGATFEGATGQTRAGTELAEV